MKPAFTRAALIASSFALALGLLGCQTPPTAPATATMSAAAALSPAVPPPSDPVRASMTERALAFASSNATRPACELGAGEAMVHRFKHGRYAVAPAAGSACANAGLTRVWVEKRFVEIADSAYAPLLERVREIPGLVLDMVYASDRIFCESGTSNKACMIREPLYGKPRCYLAPPVAAKLRDAAAALQARDPALRLRIYDCYRPVDVQIEMFERVGNPEWVAAPKAPRYGGHNRGIAIDFTIERDGVALDMGSSFDLFTEISNYDAKGLMPQAVANRKFLRDLMVGLGLRPYDGEWWHFSLPIETRAMNFPL